MKDNLRHIDDLIAKVLAGEAGREEVDFLEGWMDELPENKDYFEQTKKMFAQIDNFKTEFKVDTSKAWEKLNTRITESETKIIPLFRRTNILRAAASILLIAALGFLINYMFNTSSAKPLILSAKKQILEQKLPDGSKVTLNRNSEIAYVMNKKNVREVKLKGEAYFEVVHNEKMPFEIVIDDIIIKDIGTAFNVKALPGSNIIEVLVESGEVQFYSESSKGLTLVKGEKAMYDKTTKQFTRSIPDPIENTISYKSRIFHFKESSLNEVITQVNDVYGSNIRLSDESLGDLRVTTLFNNEDLETLLGVLAETLDLEIERKGEVIILKGRPSAE
jgi:transmembrane sensor